MFAAAQVEPPPPQDLIEPYDLVDNQQADWTNLNLYPFRPMVLSSDGLNLYAVNTHDSTVRRFQYSGPGWSAPQEWRMPWGPVSVAIYDSQDGLKKWLLVVCRGTHALAVLDRLSGECLELIPMPFEPADILVTATTPTPYAYIACSGARQVVRVNLQNLSTKVVQVLAAQPAFLSLNSDGRILVAPLISGNNSTFGNDTVVNLDNPNMPQLPDEDLFAIDPASFEAVPPTPPAVACVKTASILFAHAVKPGSNRHWQLCLESMNKFGNQSESQHKGVFANNVLMVTTLPVTGNPAEATHTRYPLDTIALPAGLAFSPSGDRAAVVGVGTHNVALLGTGGPFNEGSILRQWQLPTGVTIPRQALFLSTSRLAVYCWGSNDIVEYDLNNPPTGTPTVLNTLDVGYDPTPADVSRGRLIFYDASRSLNDNLTCASCHIEGSADQLGWNLSDVPKDHKGVLVTQTLFGINRMAPFHWRGERPELEDFNIAFPGLLGGPVVNQDTGAGLTDPEMADFKAFVFSLRSPANIGADENRVLNDELAQTQVMPEGNFVGSAIRGQDLFTEEGPPVLNGRRCFECHALPTGSNGDGIPDNEAGASEVPSMFRLEVTGFNELEDKDVGSVTLSGFGPPNRARLGFGFSHVGTRASRNRFVALFKTALGAGVTDGTQEVADVTEFLIQFDSGFGKAIHRAALLDSTHLSNQTYIQDYLIAHAEAGNCSLAVWGNYPVGGSPVTWQYDTALDKFVADSSSIAPITLADFVQQSAGSARNIFVGLPPGNAARAIDWDLDGLVNKRELTLGTDPYDPDSDNNGRLDGSPPVDTTPPVFTQEPAVLWTTAKNARLVFQTNEPVAASITYGITGVTSTTITIPGYSKVFSVILPKLLPSTNVFYDGGPTLHYDVSVTVTDDTTTNHTTWNTPPGGITTAEFEIENAPSSSTIPLEAVIGQMSFTSWTNPAPNKVRASGSVRVNRKSGGPPAQPLSNYVVVGNLLVNGAVWSNFTSSGLPTSFTINGTTPPPFAGGKFVMSTKTNGAGDATFNFTASGVPTNAKLRFNVIGIFEAPTTYPPVPLTQPVEFLEGNNSEPARNWAMPDTLKANRGLDHDY